MSEDEFVQKLKSGDRDAFNSMVNAYQMKVINIAYRMLSSEEDALDAAQETFIKVYKSINSFKGSSTFSTWIYRICTNVCNDILRKRMKSSGFISLDDDGSDENPKTDIADSSPTPEQSYELSERQRLVHEGINMLSDEYRKVIILYDIEGLSYEEISVILSCPIGTIKSRLNRARNNLKKILSENMELFS